MTRTLRLLLSATALLALWASVSQAQDYRGRIQGTITDSSQAVVPGASVTLSNVNTGVTAVRKSDDAGHYLFDLVEPGTYNVSVEAVGFSKFLQKQISLPTRGDLTVDAALKAGAPRPGPRQNPDRPRPRLPGASCALHPHTYRVPDFARYIMHLRAWNL